MYKKIICCILLGFCLFSSISIANEVVIATVPLALQLSSSVASTAPVIGLGIYAITNASNHAVPDTRQWTQGQGHHMIPVRSWVLVINQGDKPYMYPGFCSAVAAEAYAVRTFGAMMPRSIIPSPMPTTHCRGMGIQPIN